MYIYIVLGAATSSSPMEERPSQFHAPKRTYIPDGQTDKCMYAMYTWHKQKHAHQIESPLTQENS